MHYRHISFFLFALLFSVFNTAFCQSYNYLNNDRGSLTVNSSYLLDSILSKKYTYDSFKSGYDGYRVQIFFAAGTNSKKAAFEAADSFLQLGYELPAYVSFRAPYYRIRVGNFRNKIDADYYQNIVSQHFSASFVVKDFISISDVPYGVDVVIPEDDPLFDQILDDSIPADNTFSTPDSSDVY